VVGPLGVTGGVVTVYDLTETHALDRTIRENEARLARINAVTPSVIYLFDVQSGAITWVGGRAGSVLGYRDSDFGPSEADGTQPAAGRIVHPDDRPRLAKRLMDLNGLPDGEVIELEFRARRREGGYRWVLDRATAFERDSGGQLTKTLSAAIDIDERKRAEERRSLLIHELNHRVKNTLSSVQSIARQTLRSGRSPDEITEMFTARLVSLSAAHDVLTRENWEGAGLREIMRVALSPFDETRIVTSGPDVRLGARAALALGMALHELATNAAKYGALSVETGRVDLTWRAPRKEAGRTLDLEWRERGGPTVEAPRRRGFGSRLLTQGVRQDLNGAADLTFAPDGVVCRITAPLDLPAAIGLE
jgi:PAS domain S-box-containing protein